MTMSTIEEVCSAQRNSLIALDNQRLALESRIQSLEVELHKPGMPGLREKLVDAEGFPRADIDLYAVRQMRQDFARLKNDLKELMKRIDVGLVEYHAAKKSLQIANQFSGGIGAGDSAENEGSIPPLPPSGNALTMWDREKQAWVAIEKETLNAATPPPFAIIDSVDIGGPADLAGLKIGDYVTNFGSVSTANHRNLQGVAEVVRSNIGKPISVKIIRQIEADMTESEAGLSWNWRSDASAHKNIVLTPNRWAGSGLLGLHILPIS